ncbi:hypothetical protein, partial [Haloferula sp.]|uniref:hypothetical protein n=1 Tax=Haloferula sp. TaxID=2497595 RepID=UPI003C7227F1
MAGLGASEVDALPSISGVEIANPEWSIIMTPEGYSDVALDKRPGFDGREYLSGEWAAAVKYSGSAGPIWLRKTWGFPCWDTNSNFTVVDPVGIDTPQTNSDDFLRFISRISNGVLEITIRYEMVDTATGIEQGDERASAEGDGGSTTSSRYVLRQTYVVRNISGGALSEICFYHFLHGLTSGVSLYDDRDYGGPMAAYHFDNTQHGSSLSLNTTTGEIFSHLDTVCMHAMDVPTAIECGYYGVE